MGLINIEFSRPSGKRKVFRVDLSAVSNPDPDAVAFNLVARARRELGRGRLRVVRAWEGNRAS